MILGDHFPPDAKLKAVKEKLQPGRIIYLFCDFTVPEPKNKFLLLSCVDPRPLFFVINSAIHEYIRDRQHLLRCQAKIDVKSHTFLRHDSYIDCREARPDFSVDDIHAQLLSDMDRIKGVISREVQGEVVAAVKACVVLPRYEKDWILKALIP